MMMSLGRGGEALFIKGTWVHLAAAVNAAKGHGGQHLAPRQVFAITADGQAMIGSCRRIYFHVCLKTLPEAMMRLINTWTLALREFFGDEIPHYAVLSHTWGPDEVTFQDWKDLAKAREKQGFQKIELARVQAIRNNLDWLWVDTNCINKDSSAELSEAINSMFSWYRDAKVCYAFLSDVSEEGDRDEAASKHALFPRISKSHWFTRGWTLQELLAPRQVLFFSREWRQVGTRKSLTEVIAKVTNISGVYFSHKKGTRTPISDASVAERMSWLSCRETTRVEDMAYCMLGIFDINMPLLYGEGTRAFTRLQEEILKISTDESLFCWSWNEDDPAAWPSMLAPSPRNFRNAREYHSARNDSERPAPYSMTNFGLSIQLPIIGVARMPTSSVDRRLRAFEHVALLSAATAEGHLVGIPLENTQTADTFTVLRDSPRPITLRWKSLLSMKMEGLKPKSERIFVPSRVPGWNHPHIKSFDEKFSLGEYTILLLVFDALDLTPRVTRIDAIPSHSKSKAGFINLERFHVVGDPNNGHTSTPRGFHATEAHGALVRIHCGAFKDTDGPLCLFLGVLVDAANETKWFCRCSENNPGRGTESDAKDPFSHAVLETLLKEEAARWNTSHQGILSAEDSTSPIGITETEAHDDITVCLGPKFVVEANNQKTVAKAAHLVIGKPFPWQLSLKRVSHSS